MSREPSYRQLREYNGDADVITFQNMTWIQWGTGIRHPIGHLNRADNRFSKARIIRRPFNQINNNHG